eukprot:TRINITY_DN25971_c0_g1_i1.p2 TRINITY_DN25971_c0_g1~~TRINITY_DN25971_c0_g1_i1.p2  ORF type:complete len:336 (-),score=54.35 TRINITY_DN25971_c0_g1_i1:65-1072(-)
MSLTVPFGDVPVDQRMQNRTFCFLGDADDSGERQEVELTDYCSKLFSEIRHRYGYDDAAYKQSLGLDQLCTSLIMGSWESPRHLVSSGKSGSFFFISHDDKLIFKTIPRREAQTLQKMLPKYHEHVLENHDTLLTLYLGLYELAIGDTRVLFCVMSNIFPPGAVLFQTYDLKGSTQGRTVSERERVQSVALKDLDFAQSQKHLWLEQYWHTKLIRQLMLDAQFLQNEGVNDYSFLIGIGAPYKRPSRADRCFSKGIPCANDPGTAYFCGIIDILTAFEGMKVAEHALKSVYQTNFSCIPPADYAARFTTFLQSILRAKQSERIYLAATNTWIERS